MWSRHAAIVRNLELLLPRAVFVHGHTWPHTHTHMHACTRTRKHTLTNLYRKLLLRKLIGVIVEQLVLNSDGFGSMSLESID